MNKILLFLSSLFLLSCSGMNDIIEEYLNRGEVNYIGRVDSAVTHGGKERIQFVWKVGNDPRIEGCKIYWNDKRDSTYIAIDRDQIYLNGYYSYIIAVKEGSYIFNMYHVGEKGYPSVKYEVTGKSYGEKYQSNLDIRPIKKLTAKENNEIQIDWGMTEDTCTVRLKYTDLSGLNVEKIIQWQERKTILTNCPYGSQFSYTTSYKPEYQALDEFFVKSDNLTFPDIVK